MATDRELEELAASLLPAMIAAGGHDPNLEAPPSVALVDNPFISAARIHTGSRPHIEVNRRVAERGDVDSHQPLIGHELGHLVHPTSPRDSTAKKRAGFAVLASSGVTAAAHMAYVLASLKSGNPIPIDATFLTLAATGATVAARDVVVTSVTKADETAVDLIRDKVVQNTESTTNHYRDLAKPQLSTSSIPGVAQALELMALVRQGLPMLRRPRRIAREIINGFWSDPLLGLSSTHPSSAQRIANSQKGREATPTETREVASELGFRGKHARPSTIAGSRKRQRVATVVMGASLAATGIAGVSAGVQIANAIGDTTRPTSSPMVEVENAPNGPAAQSTPSSGPTAVNVVPTKSKPPDLGR